MAYAAVLSLIHTTKLFKKSINPQITKSATEELDSLRSMLKSLDDSNSRSIDRSVINKLDAKIREAVWKLEDVLESYVLHQPSLEVDEKGVEQEVNSFLTTVKNLGEEFNGVLLQKPPLPREDGSAISQINKSTKQKPLPGEEEYAAVSQINKSTTVELSDRSKNIRNDLLDGTSEQISVSLVGMAGLGKTHLATQIYNHQQIVEHFELRAWVTVGPKQSTVNNICVDIIAQLLECKPNDLLVPEIDEDTLRELLGKSLRGRRYLIVLDDVWCRVFMHNLTKLFPDEENRSRFLVTTRLQEVAKLFWRGKTHPMPFLNNEESWNLLCQNVFGEEPFPSKLEKPGRKIAENCEGLPLLILAVASILRDLEKTEEYWEKVAEKKTSTFRDAYDKIYEVLLSSYDYLPQHLKACFLYMGVFPPSCEIPLYKLIYLWGVEDFIEPIKFHKFDDFGTEYLLDIVFNSLAIACKWSTHNYDGYRWIKSSKLHSVYWYLCSKEAEENKFFHVLKKLDDVASIESHRRLSVQNNILFGIKEVYDSMAAATSSITRSLLFTGEDHQYPVQVCLNSMLLLKVLDALAIRFYEFPEEVLELLQLRYLSLTHNGELPPSISKLQQLQCLILRRHYNVIKLLQKDSTRCLPKEIWDMQGLRHLRISGMDLPDPIDQVELPNISTLHVNAKNCTTNVYNSVRSLKKLGIKIEMQPDAAETMRCFEHISYLDGLESLKCVVVNPSLSPKLVVAPPDQKYSNLPRCLHKLSLNGLGYSWEDISAIASLKHLKVLKLRCCAFRGPRWEMEADHFVRLEYLLLEDLDLVHWTARAQDSTLMCLQSLSHLIIRHCYKLKMIPPQVGDNPYLERLEVDECNPSLMYSAQKIKGKDKASDLQLVINSSWNLR